MVAAVSSGRLRYSVRACGPRTQTSPASPVGNSRDQSFRSAMRIATSGTGLPTDPALRPKLSVLTAIGAISVMP